MTKKDVGMRARFGIAQEDVAQSFLNAFVAPTTKIQTMPEQLSDAMVGMIVRGIFKPGERLHEVALSERFSVSRGPVREALRILEREGLVTMQPRRGASVTQLTRQRVKEIFAVRAVLMALCSEDLARRHPSRVLAELDTGTRELEKALGGESADEFTVLVYQLSMYLAEMAENQLAREILVSLGRQTLSFTRRAFEKDESRRTWASNWKSIVKGIRDADPVRASHSSIHLVETMRDASLAALDEMRAKEAPAGRTQVA